jgi:maltose alpha-D-glucosyltransferase/alpha-amylase
VAKRQKKRPPDTDPLWYKDAIIYELHVRAFHDADGDGIGDFPGLTRKLDYLQDLGVTTLWLLPFYPSPLRDDGYDIAYYEGVHKSYGTLEDVETFLQEAHKRDLRVITELVINHTSDQHPWFQRARHAPPGSAYRNFYVWSDTPKKYEETRIIFKDFEPSNWTWDPVAKAYYWHRFYSHQPDLNFDNPAVHKAIFSIMDFWLEMGVDGLRLDAIPYLYEREGTNCENLPETHVFLKQLRQHVDKHFAGRMLLAEANQWPEDAASYFGNGDECHMNFHFPVMPRLFMATHMEDRYPIIDILEQTPAIPENAQWAVFLRNHDELTLEMVTDEERDYMYRVYAVEPQARINLGIRRRLAPLLGNNRRRIELLNGLLFSLPGTPILYYGDEIGMGDNIFLGDRNGVRTPMQWNADRNAGFSRADPQRLYLPIIIDAEHNPEAINVEAQQNNPHSLLWWTKRLIALRKRYAAFGRGSIELLHPDNRRVLVFIRAYGEQKILVVANLSRFVQYVELDLVKYRGLVPVEMFGSNDFPAIGDLPYLLTLGPHAFYWFSLEAPQRAHHAAEISAIPLLKAEDGWEQLFVTPTRKGVEQSLTRYLLQARWFSGKARRIKTVTITDAVPLGSSSGNTPLLLFLRLTYVEGEAESYLLPIAHASGTASQHVKTTLAHAIVAHVDEGAEQGVLYDAAWDETFARLLLDAVVRRRRFAGRNGEVAGEQERSLRKMVAEAGDLTLLPVSVIKGEQSNTSVVFGDRFILKLVRRVENGINPGLEIGRFLTQRVHFAHTPPLVGALSYGRHNQQGATLAVLQKVVPNEGDAWRYTLDALDRYFEHILSSRLPPPTQAISTARLFELVEQPFPDEMKEVIGGYMESARQLGQRTAELHKALSSLPEDPAFAPEPLTTLYQRSLYQSVRAMSGQVFEVLRKQLPALPADARADAEATLALGHAIDTRLRRIVGRRIHASRIRCHGDYHLGQVLFTGKDFVIIDFEGEPMRAIGDRRLKRSALRDVAGMIRSFHYAVYTALLDRKAGSVLRPEDQVLLEPWAGHWYVWNTVAFLQAYVDLTAGTSLLPPAREDRQILLDVLLLEKALYEVSYELNNRPAWVAVPLKGIRQLLEAETQT